APARSPQAAQELLVGHPPPALRLHLEDLELPVGEARAPDDDAAAVQLPAGADVRRQRTDPVVELLGRTAPVELAVGGPDLLRVRDPHLRLWKEVLVLDRLVDERGGDRRRARVDVPRGVVRPDPELLLGRPGARVQLLDGAMDGYAGLLVAGHD